MIKLFNDSHTPIAICNPLFGKRELLGDLDGIMADLADFDTPYHIINYDLRHAFFSDTFLLWIEIDSFFKPLIGGFLEKCSIVFCEALKRGIPLRGTISVGCLFYTSRCVYETGTTTVHISGSRPIRRASRTDCSATRYTPPPMHRLTLSLLATTATITSVTAVPVPLRN